MLKKYGVIGFPIGHTMSPFIQKELFSLRNIKASYEKLCIEPQNLGKRFGEELSQLDGFNITIPHKIAIMDFLDVIDASAAEYGAVNTVCKRKGKFYGFNTDAYGFLKGLEFAGIELGGEVLVYGCGGAARAIISQCLKADCFVTVGTTTDRMEKTAATLAKIEKKQGKKIKLITETEIEKNYDLLVNTTPVGMYPKADGIPISADKLDLFNAVYDIVYNPTETKLLREAKTKGKRCGGGMSMLVCQAQQSQYHWFGAEFTREETEKVIKRSEKELERVFAK